MLAMKKKWTSFFYSSYSPLNNNLVGSQSVQYESYEVRTHGSVITSPDSNPELPETMEDTIHTDKFNYSSFFPFSFSTKQGHHHHHHLHHQLSGDEATTTLPSPVPIIDVTASSQQPTRLFCT